MRVRRAQELEVTVILERAGAPGNARLAVQVGVHDVAGRPLGTDGGLTADLLQVRIHLGLRLGDANRLIAPDLIDLVTGIVGCQATRAVAGISQDDRPRIGQVAGDPVAQAEGGAVTPRHLDLPTVGTQVAVVGARGAQTQRHREINGRSHHIVGEAAEQFSRSREAVVEHSPVQTHVVGTDLLPGQAGTDQAAHVGNVRTLAVLGPAATLEPKAHRAVGRVIPCRVLVRQRTVGQAELQHVHRTLEVLPERLLSDVPAERERRRPGPAAVRAEARGSVIAKVRLEQVAPLVVIVQSAEETCGRPGIVRSGYGRSADITLAIEACGQTQNRLIDILQSVHPHRGVLDHRIVRLESQHHLEIVRLLNVEGVIRIDVPVVVIRARVCLRQVLAGGRRDQVPFHVVVLTGQVRRAGRRRVHTVVELHVGPPVLDRFEDKRGLLVELVHLRIRPATHCKFHRRGVGTDVVVVAVLVEDRQRRPGLTSHLLVPAVAEPGGRRSLLADEAHAVTEGQVLGDLCIELRAHVETVAPVIRRFQHTVVVQVSQRSIVLDAPVAAAHAQVVLLGHHPALVELVVPVRVGVCGRIRCRPLLAIRGLVQTAGIGPAGRLEVQNRLERVILEVRGLAAVQLCGVKIQGEGVRVHRLRHIQRAGEAETVVVVDAHTVVVALLGRDQNHAEGGAGTVDGSRSRILQHRDVVDVLRVDRVDVTLHSID